MEDLHLRIIKLYSELSELLTNEIASIVEQILVIILLWHLIKKEKVD